MTPLLHITAWRNTKSQPPGALGLTTARKEDGDHQGLSLIVQSRAITSSPTAGVISSGQSSDGVFRAHIEGKLNGG